MKGLDKNKKDYLLVKDAASVLGLSIASVYRLLHQGNLENVGPWPKKYRISKRSVERLLETNSFRAPVYKGKGRKSRVSLKVDERERFFLDKLGLKMSILANKLLSQEEVLKLALSFAYEHKESLNEDFFKQEELKTLKKQRPKK